MKDQEGWAEEMRSAWLYRAVAEAEPDVGRQALFRELAAEATKQAQLWAERAAAAGRPVPRHYAPGVRARVVAALTRRAGPRAMRGVLAAMKIRGMSLYTKSDPGHYLSASARDGERRHRGVGAGGNLRAAVFGVNDGLLSNASLILGVAGAGVDAPLVLTSGIAGLLAGALSMAAGEYVSVRSQREMYEYQIGLERDELAEYPEEEAEELALIYAARGMELAQAREVAHTLVRDPTQALDTLAREELGLNPDDLGSPWGAAGASFVSFAAGAVLPLLPFLFGLEVGPGTVVSVLATFAALFVVGLAISLYTGRSAVAGGLRMMGIGVLAGGATYAIGSLLGVALG